MRREHARRTLGYIPSEGPGTAQADIFALGKVLYECLTGLDRKQLSEPAHAVGQNARPDRFLEINETIIKACHPQARQRYRPLAASRRSGRH